MRIGQSQDIHRLKEGRPLILGGVSIPYHLGLDGHSDADVLCHAITEAIIGALAMGDLGSHFPDNDDRYLNISSLVLMDDIYEKMIERGYRIGNVDSLVIMEKPKLRGYIDQMRRNISEHLHCDVSRVSVKATTSEKMGFVGEEKGVIAQAVVLLEEIGV
ncbi:MAG: 2-C-methyl-D-erythritol 2,4-cyclodiphosphate synthase [Erysipelotrichaceae bacterium]|nr:2-C-methyl-D-erythritol 2,4-cyclodiphosphate synthase [Erysipelotrichaceae bacterium]MBQ4253327.1 2-C-methyl-D-erythritol 2,4-cyclodiphosphate synthase [Erysipelotrichaceae bacterium]